MKRRAFIGLLGGAAPIWAPAVRAQQSKVPRLGVFFLGATRTREAADEFKRAIDADPTYAEAHYQYGVALLVDGTWRVTGLGTNSGNYTISATTNFTTWTDIGQTTADSGGVFQLIDTNLTQFARRFYRSFGPGVFQP